MEKGGELVLKSSLTDASGHSEHKLDRDIELQAGQWSSLKKRKQPQSKNPQTNFPPVDTPRKALVAAQQIIWQKLSSAMGRYKQKIAKNEDVTPLLEEIEKLQVHLTVVLRGLRSEQKGQFEVSQLPKEVQNLLK
ncbi:MAG TPA: hypothetical protein VG935_01770 [Patescibacteria group bacterium]|nr:hypothetical protein [Patescibacteria group bacterium]